MFKLHNKFVLLVCLALAALLSFSCTPAVVAPPKTEAAKAKIRYGYPVEELKRSTPCFSIFIEYPFIGRPEVDQQIRLLVDKAYYDNEDDLQELCTSEAKFSKPNASASSSNAKSAAASNTNSAKSSTSSASGSNANKYKGSTSSASSSNSNASNANSAKSSASKSNIQHAPYLYEVNYELTSTPGAVSVLFKSYTFTGGAHGISSLYALNLAVKSGDELRYKDVFANTDGLFVFISDYVYQSLYPKLGNIWMGSPMFTEGLEPVEDSFTNFTITPKGLSIHFPTYQIAPYSEGQQVCHIPLEKLLQFKPRPNIWH